jgi:hypothetical protein
MLYFKKIFLLSFVVGLVFGGANFVFAQTNSQPEVYIKNLTLTSTNYKAGDTVTGSFFFYNNKSQTVSNLYATVSLAGDYQKNTLAKVFYDSIKIGPYALQGKESKKIDFTYKLPVSVAGNNLGIQVSAVSDTGFKMGWRDVMIKVSGDLNLLNITKSFLSIGTEKFDLKMGTVVYEAEKLFLEINFTNPTGKVIEISPKLKIYNQAEPAVILNDSNLDLVRVLSGGSAVVKYELPKFANKAGVYVGEITFPDITGVSRAVGFQFHYVVVGDVATIKSLTADKLSVAKGDTISVTMNYSGPVYSIRQPSVKSAAFYDLSVKLFSEKNKLIAEYNEPLDFSEGTETTFSLTSTDQASNLRLEAVVKKGNTVLAEYNTAPLAGASQAKTASNFMALIGYILLAVGILCGIAFISLKPKHKK